MNIYDVVVVLNPTRDEADRGMEPEIMWRGEVNAPSETVAAFKAGQRAQEALSANEAAPKMPASRLEVRLRPFSMSR